MITKKTELTPDQRGPGQAEGPTVQSGKGLELSWRSRTLREHRGRVGERAPMEIPIWPSPCSLQDGQHLGNTNLEKIFPMLCPELCTTLNLRP